MTNTTPNVPRELLENIVLCYNEGEFELGTLAAECHALLSAPSPAGVDGCKCSMSISMLGDGCRHCQPQEYIDRLGEMLDEERDAAATECERLRMQLAACGVVALSNTIESAGKARQMHPDYMSASCSAVAGAVDREIALRTERDQQAQRIGELERALLEVAASLAWNAHGECRAIHDGPIMPSKMALDAAKAALSAGKEGE